MKKKKDLLATIAGALVALSTAWLLIDWENFVWDKHNIFVLCLSGVNALAGYYTTLKGKDDQ